MLLLIVLGWLILQKVPASYPLVEHPIPPPPVRHTLGGGLDGFESPYLGHTGSWDGKGGAMMGTKVSDMDAEREMGLRWTFMPVYWRKLEPNGPVDPTRKLPDAWKELDAFVVAAQARGLNVLMQAPVVGGNAGGPPDWAGRREKGKAAPRDMDALAAFAGKLAARYRPGGTLATREGWGNRYGVRAWELDNEPAEYLVSWSGQAADYAEFATKAARAIRKQDPRAVIVTPSLATGSGKYEWLDQALAPAGGHGSPALLASKTQYSIGPATDVVSFHLYEGLDSAFTGRDRTIDRSFSEVRERFESWERKSPGFEYARKQEYWHTEGSFDFFGVLSKERRAAWRFQFFTRAFAAGIRKVNVMDASKPEQAAVRAYTKALPDPFPMLPADTQIKVLNGKATAFRHPDRSQATASSPLTKGGPRGVSSAQPTGQVWVLWAKAKTGAAEVEVPVRHSPVEIVTIDGRSQPMTAVSGKVRVRLLGDEKMAPPVLLIDRPGK